VDTGNKFAGHMEGTQLVVHVAAGGTEAAFTAKRNKLEISTMRAAIKSPTMRRIPTVNHLVNIFKDRGSGMEFITDMFIVIRKNGL
jgi:hypothetical protein